MAFAAFTLPHFEAYSSRIVLDSEECWVLEDFQAEIVEPILWAIRNEVRCFESWTIVPQGNGKTTLLAGLALYCADYAPNPWVPVGASSRDQAEVLAHQAFQMVRSTPGMLQRFRIYEGYRRIQPIRGDHPAPGSRGIKVHSADVGTNDGVIPYPLAVLDELHRHPDLNLYRLWRGKLPKRGAVLAGISTAGEPGTEFESTRDILRDKADKRTRRGARTKYEGPGWLMNEWKVSEDADALIPEKVKEANPFSGVTIESIRATLHSPTLDIGDFKRLTCNMPARSSSSAVSEGSWDAAFVDLEIPLGEKVALGVDVAWSVDYFAIVPSWPNSDEGFWLLGEPRVLSPPKDGSMIDVDDVHEAFEWFFDRWAVTEVIIDIQRAQDVAQWVEKEHGVPVIAWNVGNAQKAADFECWMEGLRSGTLRHNGSSVLRRHVMHAVAKRLPGDKKRFDRPLSSRGRRKQDERVIDALDAASSVFCHQQNPPVRSLPFDASAYRIVGLVD